MNNRIRILHVAQAAGGVDLYIRMLFKYLDKEKYENVLVCSSSFNENDYKNLSEYFEYIDISREICTRDLKSIYEVRKLIKKYEPDIVYAHSSKAGVIARIANIGINNLCLYNPHGWAFNMKDTKKQWMYAMIERSASVLCKKIICISDAEKRSAIERRICNKKKLHVIFNGIDISYYESHNFNKITRNNLGIPEDAYVIGMVGRVSKQKAPDVFIKAASIIKKNIPNAYFIIVGSGEQEQQIQKEAYYKGLADSLLITGWVKNPMNYIALFDIALLLSRWEGFGLVLPEYMIAGKPIIATKVDAIPDIICNRVNGVLVEVDDVEAVSNAVTELFSNTELCMKLVTNGKKEVYKRFDVIRVADEHSDLFCNLLNLKITPR